MKRKKTLKARTPDAGRFSHHLLALADSEKLGYAIMKDVEEPNAG
jgi:hypothetical protein